ncbi:hypothetical protein BBOR36S_04868 [Brevibacillus borstelensis]|jgi:hypothetical protein
MGNYKTKVPLPDSFGIGLAFVFSFLGAVFIRAFININ